jgi:rare lipoprotein A
MANHFDRPTATTHGDAPIQTGGDRSINHASAQIHNLRQQPGQGLRDHQERFKKTDVAGMGFPNTQILDGGHGHTDNQSLTQQAGLHPKHAPDKSHACHVNPGDKPNQAGVASIFSERERTATGEMNDPSKHTAASKELPLNSKVCVTRPGQTEGTEVRINDRGPYVKGRVIDMTPASAGDIGIDELGKVNIYKNYAK